MPQECIIVYQISCCSFLRGQKKGDAPPPPLHKSATVAGTVVSLFGHIGVGRGAKKNNLNIYNRSTFRGREIYGLEEI